MPPLAKRNPPCKLLPATESTARTSCHDGAATRWYSFAQRVMGQIASATRAAGPASAVRVSPTTGITEDSPLSMALRAT